MRYRRVGFVSLIMLGLLLVAATRTIHAGDYLQGDQCRIGRSETIRTDLYVACNTLTIDGTVEGDLIGSAWSAFLGPASHIEGDIWLVGGQLQVEGTVDDDIRFAGVDLDLTEQAVLGSTSDLTAAALNVEIWEGAALPGELIFFGYQAIVAGRVDGDVSFNGSALIIGGAVGGDVYARVGSGETSPSFIPFPFPFSVSFQTPGLTVRSGGNIAGNLDYAGARPGNINGRINGEINFTLDLPRPDITQAALEDEPTRPGEIIVRYLNAVLVDVLSLMTAGVLLMVVAPAWVREPARIAPRQAASSFGWGLILSLMAIPVSLIVLLVSVLVLVLLSMITLGGFTAMGLVLMLLINVLTIGGLGFVILFVARLVFSYVFGSKLARRFITTDDQLIFNLLALLLGTALYSALTNIPVPVIGLVINAVGVFIGLGAIALHARGLYQRTFRSYPAAANAALRPAVPPPALEALRGETPEPPPDSAERPGPGMANLPEGFKWWNR